MSKPKIRGLGLLLGAVALGAVAQYTLNRSVDHPEFWEVGKWLQNMRDNSSPLLGLILYALAGLIFILGLVTLGDRPRSFASINLIPGSKRPRFGFWFTSLGLVGLTTAFVVNSAANSSGPGLAIIWLLSILLFLFSVIRPENFRISSIQKAYRWFRTRWVEICLVIDIVLVAFCIRIWNIELYPYSFINDEGQKGSAAACILDGSCPDIFSTGWEGQPILGLLPASLSIGLLGRTAVAVRLVSVLTGTLAVLGVYLFCREVFDQRTAVIAALLLSFLPLNVHFSRIALDNIVDSLSATWVIWLLFRGVKHGSSLCFMAAGMLAGLFFYTYPGSRIAVALGLATLVVFTLSRRGFLSAHIKNIALYILAFGLIAAPILGYFSTHRDIFNQQMNDAGIFQNGTVANEMQTTGKNVAAILTNQFLKSSLVFIATPAPSNFFNSPAPYLDPLEAIFFMLGLAYTLWHIQDARYTILLLWFLAAIILGSTITSAPPSSQRLLMSTSAAVMLIAIGISKTVDNIWSGGIFSRVFSPGILLVFILIAGCLDINFYFNEYRLGRYFEDPVNEFTYETHTLIASLHTTGQFYLICDPSIPYLSFANFNYFSPEVKKSYFYDITPQAVADLPHDMDALFIATADHKTEIGQLAQLIPGGEWSEFDRRTQPDQVLFYSYKVKESVLNASKP